MNRKTLIIILVITLLLLLAGGTYWYYTNKLVGTTPVSEFPGESGALVGGGGPVPTETSPEDDSVFAPGSGATLPRLYELHKAPVAGVGFAETKDKKGFIANITARYIERGLGHIYETQLSTYSKSRIVNETRSRIGEALWGNNGKSVVVRFVDDKEGGTINTRVVNISVPTISFARGTSTEAISTSFLKTEEIFLPDFIPFMAISEDGADKLFYLEGGSGSTATYKDTSVSKIFNSAFTEWLPKFPNQKLVTLTTRPSATVPGHMFFLNTDTKAVTKILGGINGLTTLTSRDGKIVLYSEIKEGFPELSAYDVAKNEFRSLYLQTLPEKCVWSSKKTTLVYCAVPQALPNAIYPDQWYQGLVSFSDELWEIDTRTFVTRKIMTPRTLDAPVLDIIDLAVSSDDSYLIFINKVSSNPWVYSIIEPAPITVATPSAETTTPSVEDTASFIAPDMQKLR
ncbi:MAG: hypothetical protein COV32_02970 [Candidatus Yonathbacteria bacterium CG10_big_fil_rev_8_21_14_0_10_43_136]|uniref:Uncharacterized protein n=2 Tax=Parcubacteria group TaxID=1794811 RepID=A0A2M7Q5F7_9BACT|nr:MAG: hypothetical protein AUK15_00390 [Candidatus Nomurabacteria bacterium CG2_30_43_9]PIR40524.1 MAG: hypothetical protein COV32_02970 [Candidatus Yonathbacteria bacterium CG10_big_fil_rev_8_21_14_0_10_43_136]PIX57310.1 MAG: hypothetical protein COZ48_01545 [Candidatus Yonathbacteria bacterium CG_4_10_14_3_um_filter_43_12]PIY58677.1 MAG: hypothetical protein COY98_00810 [Candidatus Yonathbacteria bacterium CG_4_10_14_0_8_um_filter_43_17]PJC21811.1 MAG: hypothetical protein CO060_02510 [Cand